MHVENDSQSSMFSYLSLARNPFHDQGPRRCCPECVFAGGDQAGVLIIDDNDVMRSIVTMLLQEEGFTVESCASGESGLELAKKKYFGTYVIDYSMPKMKGDVVTSEIRKLHPAAFIIGYSIEPKAAVFLDAGADKFMLKEDLMKELIQSIKER